MKKVEYRIDKKEVLINILIIVIIISFLGKLFYGKFIYGIGLAPMSVVLYKIRVKEVYLKKKRKLSSEFKDMLVTISELTSTGYSVENAIRESYKELKKVHGEDSHICKEVITMISKLKINIPVEDAIGDFVESTQLEEAFTFYQTFVVAKKRGGSLVEVIKNITDTIVLKENVKEDIEVAVAEKKMEQKIMCIIPLGLIAFINFSSPGYLNTMYETWMGKLIMTICLLIYISAYVWSRKISEIEI